MPSRPRSTNFYARALAQEEQQALERARVVKGLDDDIALARTSTLAVAGHIRRDPRLVFQGLDTIAHLHTVRFRTSGSDDGRFLASVTEVLRIFDDPAFPEDAAGSPLPLGDDQLSPIPSPSGRGSG